MTTPSTHFDILGLPRRYHLRPEEIEDRYHAAAREHHPDRHMRSDAQKRVSSALFTAQLTEAYRTLKDPVRRAEYLLKLEGIVLSDERSGHKVDPTFLHEILELREGLMEARMEGDEARIAALGSDVRERQARAMSDVDRGFARYDTGETTVLRELADALVALRYYRRFLDELEAHEEAQLEERSS
ncbi:MAG TPA: Fe-S protein assembly co-chaperone HscB [Polyangia bacterium]|nr:Fe-S protein assembly co-chaperone HscB [Polyangia bacterium]